MAQTELEVFTAARATIAQPENWTQGAAARNANGYSMFADNPYAVQWCSTGVLDKVNPVDKTGRKFPAGQLNLTLGNHINGFYEQQLGEDYEDVCGWNDDPARTHAEVLAAFDSAIDTLKMNVKGG